MSRGFSGNSPVQPQYPHLETGNLDFTSQGPESPHRQDQGYGSSMQYRMSPASAESSTTKNFGSQSPSHEYSQNGRYAPAAGAPVPQPAGSYVAYDRRRPSMTQSPVGESSQQFDALMRENAQLRRDLQNIQLDREQIQTACDNMLTKVLESEDLVAAKDVEILALQNEVHRLSTVSPRDVPDALRPGHGRTLSDGDRELNELHLKCNRLTMEAERKDEQLRQTLEQVQALQANARSPTSSQAFNDARQQEVMTLKLQLSDWQKAYSKLDRTVKTMQTQAPQPAIDEQALRQMKNAHATEMEGLQRTCEFFKENSEKLSIKNKALVDENQSFQRELSVINREVGQQKSMIDALKVQPGIVYAG